MGRKPYDRKRIEDGIREHVGKLSCRHIARILDVTPATIYKYAGQLGISLETPAYKRQMERKRKRVFSRSKFFNVKQQSNWLV